VLEHVAHLVALQMPKPQPGDLSTLLLPGAIEKDRV
jgi:hypothetical protein